MGLTRLVKRTTAPTCGHHWHVTDAGWRCCWCPDKAPRRAAPPASRTGLCLDPDDDVTEPLVSWLASLPAADETISRRPGPRRRVRA